MKLLLKPEKIKRSPIGVIILTVLALSIGFQFIVSNVLALGGQEAAKLETKTQELSRQNRELRDDLAGRMSLSKIARSAQSLGFTSPAQVKYFDLSQSVATLPQ